MELYTVVVNHLRMCMKGDYPGPKKSREIIEGRFLLDGGSPLLNDTQF